MPWQTRGQTRGLIASAVETLRIETIEKLRNVNSTLENVNTRVGDLATSLATVQESIEGLRVYSEKEKTKLAVVIEGAVRTVLAYEHGREYAFARKIGSLHEALCYLKEMCGENENWLRRVESDVVGFLLCEDTVGRTARLMEMFFIESKNESWKELRKVVKENPMVDSEGQLICRGFARAISPAPRFYRALLVEFKNIAAILDRSYFCETSLSLMTCLLAADTIYEEGEFPPPFQLEWDCQGAVQELGDGTIHLFGAEIKSSKTGFGDGVNQLCLRFSLLIFLLRHAYPSWARRQIVAEGRVVAPWLKNGKPANDTTKGNIDPSATAFIICEELESFQ